MVGRTRQEKTFKSLVKPLSSTVLQSVCSPSSSQLSLILSVVQTNWLPCARLGWSDASYLNLNRPRTHTDRCSPGTKLFATVCVTGQHDCGLQQRWMEWMMQLFLLCVKITIKWPILRILRKECSFWVSEVCVRYQSWNLTDFNWPAVWVLSHQPAIKMDTFKSILI